jgi:hypothetical protein
VTRAREIASQGGLVLISSTTIGSAVTSITVSNVFSATYDNYKIIMSGGTASFSNDINMTLGSANTGYNTGLIVVNYTTSAVVSIGRNNLACFTEVARSNTTGNYANIELNSPFLNVHTRLIADFENANNTGQTNGIQTSTTSFTSFTFTTANAATMTGGTIQVYGYKK